MSQRIFRDEILTLIPHAGSMCFWDAVEHWDADNIRCSTISHRDALHPLRCKNQLSAIHLAEYGAQAIAIHGGLLARGAGSEKVAAGMLVSLRDYRMQVSHIDDVAGELIVNARKLVASTTGSIYEFVIRHSNTELARGRVSVMGSG